MAAEDLGLSGWKEGYFAQVRRDEACDGIFDKDLNNTTDVGRKKKGRETCAEQCQLSCLLFRNLKQK